MIQYDLAPHGINVGMLYVSKAIHVCNLQTERITRRPWYFARASALCFCLQGFPGHANLTQQLAFLDLCAKAGFKVIQTRPVPS